MNEDLVAALAANVIEAYEAFIAALLKNGLNTWELVEQYGMAPTDPDECEEFRRYWDMRVGH